MKVVTHRKKVYPPLFKGWGIPFLRRFYGNKRIGFQSIVLYVRNVLSGCGLAFFLFAWFSLCSVCLADGWSEVDAGRLQHIHDDIQEIQPDVSTISTMMNRFPELLTNVEALKDYVNVSFGLNLSGFPRGYLYSFMNRYSESVAYDTDSIFGRLNLNLETYGQNIYNNQREIVGKLDNIITAIESLGSGGSGGSGEIEQNWLTEAKYTEIANQFLTSWGFEGGSGGTFRESFDRLGGTSSLPSSFTINYRKNVRLMDSVSPFPDDRDVPIIYRSYWYGYEWEQYKVNASELGWLGLMSTQLNYLNENFISYMLTDTNNRRKQAWNDWQAHTNLVDTLYTIFKMENPEKMSFNAESGTVIVENSGGTGTSDESYNVTPTSTNTVDVAVTAVTESEKSVKQLFSKEEIESRYINDNLLSVGQSYGVDDSPENSARGVFSVDGWWTIDLGDWAKSYRKVFDMSLLDKFRKFSSYFWKIVLVCVCILIVRRWGNM